MTPCDDVTNDDPFFLLSPAERSDDQVSLDEKLVWVWQHFRLDGRYWNGFCLSFFLLCRGLAHGGSFRFVFHSVHMALVDVLDICYLSVREAGCVGALQLNVQILWLENNRLGLLKPNGSYGPYHLILSNG